jgi:Protein of unknown function (DUF732)
LYTIVTKVKLMSNCATRAPALILAAGLMTAAATVAAPVQADTIDTSFLNALTNAGVGFNDPAATVSLGQSVCPMLVEPGKSFASVYSRVANNGISPEMAAFFTGIAISMYCPQMMSGIGNGTLLHILGIPGLNDTGIPGLNSNGIPGLTP